ncbi:MAG: hypothetical protein LBJ95_03715 [Oscillospiraceae bacterium]|jgi:hypothetical protein|nr:hypothetical protein [Oscillospiraceae bacterium]
MKFFKKLLLTTSLLAMLRPYPISAATIMPPPILNVATQETIGDRLHVLFTCNSDIDTEYSTSWDENQAGFNSMHGSATLPHGANIEIIIPLNTTARLETSVCYDGTTHFYYTYWLPTDVSPYPVVCTSIRATNNVSLTLDCRQHKNWVIYQQLYNENTEHYLHELLHARLIGIESFLKNPEQTPTVTFHEELMQKTFEWELSPTADLPDSITAELYAEEANIVPLPYRVTVEVTKIGENIRYPQVVGDEGTRVVPRDTPDSAAERRTAIAVLGSLVLPDKLHPNRVNLVVLPLTPDCDISFGARALKSERGQTKKLEEKRTEWRKTNAVQMMRPLAGQRIPRCIQIQYVAWLRPSGMSGPVTEVLLQGA